VVGRILLVIVGMASSCKGPSLVEWVVRIDSRTLRCLDCPPDFGIAALERTLSFKGSPEIGEWAKRSFRSSDPDRHTMSSDLTGDELFGALDSLRVSGFAFDDGRVRLVYSVEHVFGIESIERLTGKLARLGASNEVLWKRSVPIMRHPVYPLVQADKILYVGARSSLSQRLYILSIDSGRVLDSLEAPPEEPDGFSNGGLLFCLPYYHAGMIYLEGSAGGGFHEIPTKLGTCNWGFATPPNIYVAKVSF
jgi:hypothetical protein